MNRRTFLAGTAAALSWAAATRSILSAQAPGQADWILRGATIYDGTGGDPFTGDVAVRGERIAAVGKDLSSSGARLIDARRLAIAPGFIDIHSHTDLSLLVDPHAESKVRQGVTTEVTGQDGSSIGPWSDAEFEQTRDSYRTRYAVAIDFRDLAGFFARLTRDAPSVNVASMVGNGTVRNAVIGEAARVASPEELARMIGLVRTALDAGACGVSSGLEYVPSGFADLDELVALARPPAAMRLPYASHLRNEDDRLLGAIEEAINVGRFAHAPVQVSHLKAQGQRNWSKADLAIELQQRAAADGLDVAYDCYPYIAFSTNLTNLFPLWSRDGGNQAFLARLADQSGAPRLEEAVRDKIAQLGDWNAVQITSTANDALAWARGRRLGDLARERNTEPYAFLTRLIADDGARTGMVGFGMSEENIARFLAHPLGMICSDAGARAISGPLAEGSPHPRAYGTFPRVLGKYVREQHVMRLETAIHKMTMMPAMRLHFRDRGVLVPGAMADLVVFDPATVADRATFERPHQYPVGIPHVIVAGQFVIRDGEHTGARPGRIVKPDPIATAAATRG